MDVYEVEVQNLNDRGAKLPMNPSHYKDSWHSWLVCAVSFLVSFMTVGFSFAIGIYFVAFLDIFKQTSATTSWVSSLNYGILCNIGKDMSPDWGLSSHLEGVKCSMSKRFIKCFLMSNVVDGNADQVVNAILKSLKPY